MISWKILGAVVLQAAVVSTVAAAAVLCRDQGSSCFPDMGQHGWYSTFCNKTFVAAACPFMCGLCEHEVYSDGNILHYTFDSLIEKKFLDRLGWRSEVVGGGVRCEAGGRVKNQLSLKNGACLHLGNFKGSCLSDPSPCSAGISLSFFLDFRHHQSRHNLTFLTSGAHGPSTGVFFGYEADQQALSLRVRTADRLYSLHVDEARLPLQTRLLVHLVLTLHPTQGMRFYVEGRLVRHTQSYAYSRAQDTSTDLRLGCAHPGDPTALYLKVDELAAWNRTLSEDEVQNLSDTVGAMVSMTTGFQTTTTSSQVPGDLSLDLDPAANFSTAMEALTSLERDFAQSTSSSVNVTRLIDVIRRVANASYVSSLTHDESSQILKILSDILNTTLKSENLDILDDFSDAVLPGLLHSVDSLLEAVSTRALHLATPLQAAETRLNFELRVQKGKAPRSEFKVGTGETVSVKVNTSEEAVLVSSVYKALGGIFPTENQLHTTHNSVTESSRDRRWVVSQQIIGVSLYPDDLPSDVSLSISFPLPASPSPLLNARPSCVFLDVESAGPDEAFWTDTGCHTFVTGSDVTCICNHMTNFAMLMQIVSVEMSEEHRRALSLVSYIGCSLSILGATLTVLTFLFLRIYTDRVVIHMNLAIAIIGAQILLLVEDAVTRGTSLCLAVAVLLFYFNMAVFGWMLVEGVQLFLQVVVVFNHQSRLKTFHLVGWGGPALVVAVGAGSLNRRLGAQGICWLSPLDGSIWAFAAPALLVIVVNLVILTLVMRVVCSLSCAIEENKLRSVRAAVRGAVMLLPLLGCSWLFGVLAVAEVAVAFQYAFAITNSLQGMTIFVCHCVCNSEVRDSFLRRKSLWELSRQLHSQSKVDPESSPQGLPPARPPGRPGRQAARGGQGRDTPSTASSSAGTDLAQRVTRIHVTPARATV